jgi:hypothetical protein
LIDGQYTLVSAISVVNILVDSAFRAGEPATMYSTTVPTIGAELVMVIPPMHGAPVVSAEPLQLVGIEALVLLRSDVVRSTYVLLASMVIAVGLV